MGSRMPGPHQEASVGVREEFGHYPILKVKPHQGLTKRAEGSDPPPCASALLSGFPVCTSSAGHGVGWFLTVILTGCVVI